MLAYIMPGSLGPAILLGRLILHHLGGGGGGISVCVLWGVIMAWIWLACPCCAVSIILSRVGLC